MKLDGKHLIWTSALLFAMASCVAIVSVGAEGRKVPSAFSYNQCWQRSFPDQAGRQLGVDAGTAYVAFEPAIVKTVDVQHGRDLWSTELGGSVVSNLLVAEKALYIVSGLAGTSEASDQRVVRSISKQTGITNWSVPFRSAGRVWVIRTLDTIVAVGESGHIAALAAESGVARWETAISGPLTAEPALAGGRLLLGTAENKLQILSAADGRTLSVLPTKFEPTAVAFVFDGKILAGDERGNLSLFPVNKPAPIWNHKSGARIASIEMTGRGALVASFDNFVYMLSDAGDVVWKRRLPARPGAASVILGTTALFSSGGDEPLYVVDLSNGRILNQLNLPGAVAAVPSGDRNIIFLSAGGLSMYSPEGCSANEKRQP